MDDDNMSNSSIINIEEFLKIYPPFPNKNTIFMGPSKFSKIFSFEKASKRISVINDKKSSIVRRSDSNKSNNNSIDNSFKKNLDINIKNNNDRFLLDIKKDDYYLLNKGIELQNRNKKRTTDVKKSLSLFFRQSDLITKLSEFFKKYGENQVLENNNKNGTQNNNMQKKNSCVMTDINNTLIENKIKLIIQKLVDNSKIEKYNKNEQIIKMNDIGNHWYFLICGKLSILKPIFYNNIKLTYELYFKYLLSLINHKEIDLAKQILELNKNHLNIYSIQSLIEIIKVYSLMKVRNYIQKYDEYKPVNINKIEQILNEFNLSLSDLNLNKNEILFHINKLTEETDLNSDFKNHKAISQYLLTITSPTEENLLVIKTYNFLFNDYCESNNDSNIIVVTLVKYELFMYLEPGSFFGETALENDGFRRNATIRAEENSFIVSLNSDIYNEIFLEKNKKLKLEDVEFICSNYFFSNISPVIFKKYYYPLLILSNKKKNDTIYLQDEKISSIYLLKEGSIKYEIYVSILDINEIIKILLENLIKYKKNFKIDNDILNDIKNNYILNKKIFNIRNQNELLNVELRKKYTVFLFHFWPFFSSFFLKLGDIIWFMS